MNEGIYIFNGKDITMNVFLQIRAVIKVIQKELDIDFFEALGKFYSSNTYLVLQNVDNGFWAESAEYIADRYFEEIDEKR